MWQGCFHVASCQEQSNLAMADDLLRDKSGVGSLGLRRLDSLPSTPYETPNAMLPDSPSPQSSKVGIKRASTACQSCKRIKRKVREFVPCVTRVLTSAPLDKDGNFILISSYSVINNIHVPIARRSRRYVFTTKNRMVGDVLLGNEISRNWNLKKNHSREFWRHYAMPMHMTPS